MRARTGALALALALSACGGGGNGPGAQPSSPAAPSSAAALDGDARLVKDAVEKTLAECPCRLSLRLHAYGGGGDSYSASLTGVYDPKTMTAAFRDGTTEKGKRGTFQIRVVGGKTYLLPEAGTPWVELDFAGLPAPPVSVLATMVLADPAMAFALARNVAGASFKSDVGTSKLYDGEFDVAGAVAAAGPSGDLLRRLVTAPTLYDAIKIGKNGRVDTLSFLTSDDPDASGTVSVFLYVTAVGVTAPPVTAPAVVRTIDVASERF